MFQKNTKPSERKFQVLIAQSKAEGQDAYWDSQEIMATTFSVDDNGNLLFWRADALVAVISPGNWQRVEEIEG